MALVGAGLPRSPLVLGDLRGTPSSALGRGGTFSAPPSCHLLYRRLAITTGEWNPVTSETHEKRASSADEVKPQAGWNLERSILCPVCPLVSTGRWAGTGLPCGHMANEAEPGRCSWPLLPAPLQGPQTLRDSLRVSSGLLLIYSFLGFLVGTKSTVSDLFLDIRSHLNYPEPSLLPLPSPFSSHPAQLVHNTFLRLWLPPSPGPLKVVSSSCHCLCHFGPI